MRLINVPSVRSEKSEITTPTLSHQLVFVGEQMLGAIFGNNTASKELSRLHYHSNVTVAELQSRILTDYSYTCTTSAIAELLAHGYQNVWRYFFNASFPNHTPFKVAGAWHTSEIPLVFGTYRMDNETTATQVRLSDSMQSAWAGFTKHPEDGPGWPMFRSQDKDLQLFDTNYAVRGRTIDRNLVDTACSYYDVSVRLNGLEARKRVEQEEMLSP